MAGLIRRWLNRNKVKYVSVKRREGHTAWPCAECMDVFHPPCGLKGCALCAHIERTA